MEQKDRGCVLWSRFPIEDGEPIDLNCAIKDLGFHCFVLCLGIYFKCSDERQCQHCNGRENRICRIRGVHTSPLYPEISKITSSSTGIPSGRLATPITSRTAILLAPNTSRNR